MKMKTYNDLYEDYKNYCEKNPDVSEEEYDKVMNTQITLIDVMNKLVEYTRFLVFSKQWLEDNSAELIKNNDEETNE